MKRLLVSAAALAGVAVLLVGLTAYARTFHPDFHDTREPY